MFACTASLALLHASPAQADVLGAVNDLRREGCQGRPGLGSKLQQTRRIDAVASRWSKGGSLTSAVAAAGLRLKQSIALRVPATSSDTEVRTQLAQRNCREITSGEFREIGVSRNGGQLWIVVAAPFQVPAARDAKAIAADVLALTNRARAAPRRCGTRQFAAVAPLKAAAKLDAAALEHSRDMARRNFLEHAGSDGSTPADRVTRQGYKWALVGENVAGGPQTAKEVVEGWIASPGHCANIMQGGFTEMGIAFAADERAKLVIYWTQSFGTPR